MRLYRVEVSIGKKDIPDKQMSLLTAVVLSALDMRSKLKGRQTCRLVVNKEWEILTYVSS